MVTFYREATKAEQERIQATFRTGHAHCKAALFTLLHALVTLLLFAVYTFTFIVNFTIGVLTIMHALGCMLRLLLVQWQEATRTPLVTVAGREW